MSNPADITLRLCSACTMCCNGVLFADVELKNKDNHNDLVKAGLSIHPKTKRISCLSQPCTALQPNGTCSAYNVRPQMCRAFECRLLQRASEGKIGETQALNLIKQLRQNVTEAETILNELGDSNPHLPLSKRYAHQMMSPFDLGAGRKSIRLRERLMKVMDKINDSLSRNFLS